LLAIADAAGGEWPARARAAAETLAGSRGEGEDDAIATTLLADLRDLFEQRKQIRLSSSEIVEHLGAREERPWSEWMQGKPMTTRQLAALLKPYGIEPRSVRLSDNKTAKGRHLIDMEDAFKRYLPCRAVTPSQTPRRKGFGHFPCVTGEGDVPDAESPKVPPTGRCDVVPDQDQGTAGGEL
jgi:hypothetical protein